MVQNNNNTIAIIAVVAALILAGIYMSGNMPKFIGAVTGAESVSRVLPASAGKGTTFPVTWNLAGASGRYAVMVKETITGGCTFTDGTTMYSGLFTDPDTSLTMSIVAPAVAGSCTFSGVYYLSNVTTKQLSAQSVPIVCAPVWASGAWSSCTAACAWASQGACVADYTATGTQTRANTDSANCGVTTGQPATSQSCTSPCTRVITKNTDGDTNCDNKVNQAELIAHLGRYVDGGVDKANLILVMRAWVNGGGI
jgi:hypothetical protein